MHSGKYQSSEGAGVAIAVTFLLIGLGAGALTALLLAPKTGKQLRRDIRREYEVARDTIDDWTEEAKDRVREATERGTELAENIREKVEPLRRVIARS